LLQGLQDNNLKKLNDKLIFEEEENNNVILPKLLEKSSKKVTLSTPSKHKSPNQEIPPKLAKSNSLPNSIQKNKNSSCAEYLYEVTTANIAPAPSPNEQESKELDEHTTIPTPHHNHHRHLQSVILKLRFKINLN
jgi:hypothetical protein